jgi:hypothetical protein
MISQHVRVDDNIEQPEVQGKYGKNGLWIGFIFPLI